jgi:hypothetical protein
MRQQHGQPGQRELVLRRVCQRDVIQHERLVCPHGLQFDRQFRGMNGGQKSKAGYHLYWKKNDCGIYPARSNSTQGFAAAGGFELNVGGKWVYKNITAQSGSCPSGI